MIKIDWQPTASIENIKHRAKILANIRAFFDRIGYLEVETPIMAHFGVTDVYLSNIKAKFRQKDYYLMTSPEYHMKRLLAFGSGPIYQIARVFRDDELGRMHNPEFSLLEWYRLGVCQHTLLVEMDMFLQEILKCQPLVKMSYQQAFIESCNIDPFVADVQDLNHCLQQFSLTGVLSHDEKDIDQYLFLLMSHVVEPFIAQMGSPVAIYDFPASQASLAKIENNRAQRFEVYYQGVELANGFHELTDYSEQKLRFERDRMIRREHGLEDMQFDKYFLAALENGLPECSGVALGIDRLLAISLSSDNIADVISFPISRA